MPARAALASLSVTCLGPRPAPTRGRPLPSRAPSPARTGVAEPRDRPCRGGCGRGKVHRPVSGPLASSPQTASLCARGNASPHSPSPVPQFPLAALQVTHLLPRLDRPPEPRAGWTRGARPRAPRSTRGRPRGRRGARGGARGPRAAAASPRAGSGGRPLEGAARAGGAGGGGGGGGRRRRTASAPAPPPSSPVVLARGARGGGGRRRSRARSRRAAPWSRSERGAGPAGRGRHGGGAAPAAAAAAAAAARAVLQPGPRRG